MKHLIFYRFSSYYYPYVHKDFLEPNSALQTSTERQLKDVNSSRNALWTDQYQPQTCQEVISFLPLCQCFDSNNI